VADQLQQLAALHQQGMLTDDEFAAAKAKLLGS
jgi:Short C-terminal domain